MDETALRQDVCHAAHQLWLRGLIVADGGLVTAEVHRRRFLVLPAGRRRADLKPEELPCLDLAGRTVGGEPGLDPAHWRPHRLAYEAGAEPESFAPIGAPARRQGVRATVLAMPAVVMGLLREAKDAPQAVLELPGLPALRVVPADDDAAVQDALRQAPVVALRDLGVLAAGASLADALNWIERIDHAARIARVGRP